MSLWDSAAGLLRTTISNNLYPPPALEKLSTLFCLGGTGYSEDGRTFWAAPRSTLRVRIQTGLAHCPHFSSLSPESSQFLVFGSWRFPAIYLKISESTVSKETSTCLREGEKRAPGIMYWVFEEYINLLSSHFKVASHILSWFTEQTCFFFFFFLHRVD